MDPAALSAGQKTGTLSVNGGGMVARRLDGPVSPSVSGSGMRLYAVRRDALGSSVTAIADGATVTPAAGETVWVVAVNPTAASAGSVLSFA